MSEVTSAIQDSKLPQVCDWMLETGQLLSRFLSGTSATWTLFQCKILAAATSAAWRRTSLRERCWASWRSPRSRTFPDSRRNVDEAGSLQRKEVIAILLGCIRKRAKSVSKEKNVTFTAFKLFTGLISLWISCLSTYRCATTRKSLWSP